MASFTTTEFNAGESSVLPSPWNTFGTNNSTFLLGAAFTFEADGQDLNYQIVGGADIEFFDIFNDGGPNGFYNQFQAVLVLNSINWAADGMIDYETKIDDNMDGVYEVQVLVTSELGPSDTATLFITVQDYSIVSWATFQIGGGGNPLGYAVINSSIDENTTNGTELFDVSATDGSGTPAYSITADNSGGAFTIDSVTGIVSVLDGSLINYEANNGGYTITVTAAENANDSVTRDFTIGGNGIVSITDVAPSVPVDNDAATNQVFENTVDAIVGLTAFATDVATGDVRYSITDTRFVIDEVTGIVKVAPDGFPLGLDFESTPSIDLEVTASTVNGAEVSKQTFTINVLDGNDTPVMFQQQTLFADENQTSAGTPTVTDQDNDTLIYELTGGGADASLFTIDQNTGELSFKSAPDFETPNDADKDGTYAVEVKANDGKGGSATETVFVVLADKNEAPEIDQTAFNAAENIAGAADVFAADPDSGDSIEYTITGGADQMLFTISKTTGFLDFLSAPDFESPADSGSDNVYDVEVTATDSGGLTDTQLVKITVTDANDAPQITSTAFSKVENILAVGPLTVTDQDPGDTAFKNFFVTGGADGALFDIDSQTGELSFKAAPDFENAKDTNEDNIYEVEVSVSDQGGMPGTQTILVTVTDELIEPGETITGTSGADTIDLTKTVKAQPFPTSRDDTIFGLGGNDIIDGAAGDDKVFGGAGMDILFGNIGADELDGEADADTVSYVNSDKGVTIALDGLAGTGGDAAGDKLTGIENLTGSTLGDSLTGSGVVNKIDGGLGDDLVAAGAGNDVLDGGAGLDTLDYSYLAAGQNLSLTLGAYNATTKIVAQSSAVVKIAAVTLETDSVKNFENVLGGNGNDTLTGNAGVNELFGAEGDDLLTGGAGADKLDGGEADEVNGDTASYAASAAGVFIDLNVLAQDATHDFGDGKGAVANGDAAGDTLTGIENFTGSSKNDAVVANGDVNLLNSGLGTGIDTVSYAYSTGGIEIDLSKQFTVSTTGVFSGGTAGIGGDAAGDKLAGFENVIGGDGNDTITGTTGANVIEGGAGGDTLIGKGGTDTVSYAGSATGGVWVNLENNYQDGVQKQDATVDFDDGNGVVANGDAAEDILTGFTNFIGSAYGDMVQGNSTRAESIFGGGGNDDISGGGGKFKDTLDGGLGNDNLYGGDGGDTLIGGDGSDTAAYGDADGAYAVGIKITLGKNGTSSGFSASGGEAASDKLTSIENISGTGFVDVLTGNELANELGGAEGNDTLTGNAGMDTLVGGNDNDTLIGGADADILDGGNNNDTINYALSASGVTVNLNNQGTYENDDPNDKRDVAGAIQTGGDAAGDTLWSIENIVGSKFNDVLTADSATFDTEVLDGGAGDDVIVAGESGEILLGGAGNDTLSFAADVDGVNADLTDQGKANATRDGLTTNVEIVDGFRVAEFENLVGSASVDVLVGDANANIIDGGAGGDQLDGGAGNDTVSFASLAAGVIFGLGTLNKNGTVEPTGATSGFDVDSIQNFENIIGSAHVDDLSGNDGVNVIDGGGNADTLKGFAGNDTLRGGAGNDFFEAGGVPGLGADILDGGADIDTVSYNLDTVGLTVTLGNNGASATVTGGTGSSAKGDKLIGIEQITGSSGIDKLTGNNLSHVLNGGNGNDTLAGGTGSSTLNGEAGNDIIVASAGAAEIYDGGADIDTLSFANFAVSTTVNVNLATNTHLVTGIASLDVSNFEILIGGKGDDTLTGNAASSTTIQGGNGNDTIKGGSAIDTFTGGAGNDTFVLIDAAQGKDTFTDFANGDKLQIDLAGFGIALPAGALNDATYLVVNANPSASNPGHGQFLYNTATDILSWDADGDSGTAAIEIGQFGSSVMLKLADFALA